MKKLMILALLILGAGQLNAQTALGEVIGEVVDIDNEPIYGAHVYIDDVFGQRYQAMTETDGRYRISGIPAGEYKMNIKYAGDTLPNLYVKVPINGFYNAGEITFNSETIQVLKGVVVSADIKKVKLVDGNLPIKTLDAEEIQQSSVKFSVTDLVETMSSEIQKTENGNLVIRGAREGDMLYLIDGIKTSAMGALPSSAIGSISVYTGGIPAKYGDTLGGVIILETQSYFDLYRAWKSQQLKAGK